MFDQTHATTTPAAAWHETVQRGDVVLFAFPVVLAGEGDRPKIRPCLVMEVERAETGTRITLAYGTSAMTKANRGYEVRIRQPVEMAHAGLDAPTRFVGARRLEVSVHATGFAASARTDSPVIGRLAEAGLERMNAVRARIQADRDIAAERRQPHARAVIVEHRGPRARRLGQSATR